MERDQNGYRLGPQAGTSERRARSRSRSTRGSERSSGGDHRRRDWHRSRSPRVASRRNDHAVDRGERRRRRSRSPDHGRRESQDRAQGHRRREKRETGDRDPTRPEGRFLDKARQEDADRSRSSSLRVHRPRSSRADQKRSAGSPKPRHRHHNSAAASHREQPHPRAEPRNQTVSLPLGARHLSRRDFATFEPLFAHYLDLQKGLRIRELDEDEVRGRWKSFVGKWNRAELAEGWYDPEMFARVVSERGEGMEENGAGEGDALDSEGGSGSLRNGRPPIEIRFVKGEYGAKSGGNSFSGSENDDEDDYGPAPPPSAGAHRPHGPGIPSLHDLEVRQEMDAEDQASHAADLRAARKADRRAQKERLDELVPRAEAGTRERQLEKRAAVNEKMRGFREKSPGGAEVPERDLMGGGDGVDDYRRALATAQKRKSERELRREEVARALAAEREERIRAYKEKEDRTVSMLRELARQRFG